MKIYFIVCAVLIAYGMWLISAVFLYRERYSGGSKSLKQLAKWTKEKQDVWDIALIRKAVDVLSKFVFSDATASEQLARQLYRAGMDITPEQFTARKYLIVILGTLGITLCVPFKFWVGILICALATLLAVMKQKEALTGRIKVRDEELAAEMPRFVRTICRNLNSNRDVYAALESYRRVAGIRLGAELDTLLAHMRSGNTAVALQQFQKRLGTETAFRLCSALQEIERGIDQTATLEYIADDMARQAKLNLQKAISVRPAQMRRTYLPAVGVCVAMIMYVLIVFVTQQLNNLF